MKDSISNRIRITKTGKVLRRAMAQGHFLAKKSTGSVKRRKHFRGLDYLGKKALQSYR